MVLVAVDNVMLDEMNGSYEGDPLTIWTTLEETAETEWEADDTTALELDEYIMDRAHAILEGVSAVDLRHNNWPIRIDAS